MRIKIQFRKKTCKHWVDVHGLKYFEYERDLAKERVKELNSIKSPFYYRLCREKENHE